MKLSHAAVAALCAALGAMTLSAEATLTRSDVKSRIESAGYTDVENIRANGSHYDATAMKDGKPVRLDVDASTGAIKSKGRELLPSEVPAMNEKDKTQ